MQKALPSVVNISTEQVVRVSDPYEPFFNLFFAPHARYFKESVPLGSGIIVDPDGLVVTNYHVIQRASQIMVRVSNGELVAAELVAYDAENDICLLRIPNGTATGGSLQAIDFALPDDLYLGETVLTVGNPFGLEQSVSQGVLSARNRSFREGDVVFNDILQTDAAINPGNSGGPLINLDGHLIGMNLAIRRDAEGIGFAIPVQRLETVLGRWLTPCRFSSGFCGFRTETVMDGGVPQAVVSEVWEEGPAAREGLRNGDVIAAVNNVRVTRAIEVGRRIWRLQPGDSLRLELGDGRRLRLPVEAMSIETLVRRRLGVRVQPLNRALRRAMGLPDDLQGLAISEVFAESEFARHRLRWGEMVRRGDIIVQVGGVSTATMEDLHRVLQGTRSGTRVAVVLVAVDTLQSRVALSPIRVDVMLN